MISYIAVLVVGFLSQIIDGGLGMGYGVLSSSLLIAFGATAIASSATVHAAEMFTTLSSGISHMRAGNFDKRIFLPLAISGVIGGITGAVLLANVSASPIIKGVVAAILLLLGASLIYRFAKKAKHEYKVPRKMNLVVMGFIGALVDAFGGGGWGPITTPSLIASKADPKKAIGSTSMAEFFITVAISISFFLVMPSINWGMFVPMLAGGVIAAIIAPRIIKKMPTRIVGILTGVLVVILSIRTIINIL